MFSKEVGNSPGLCSVRGQYPVLNKQTTSRIQFSSLFLGTDKTPLYCHICWVSMQHFVLFLVAIFFEAFWHCCANGDFLFLFLAA